MQPRSRRLVPVASTAACTSSFRARASAAIGTVRISRATCFNRFQIALRRNGESRLNNVHIQRGQIDAPSDLLFRVSWKSPPRLLARQGA